MACFVWALCIVLLVGSALIFFKPLLIVVAPWVGHATWRAYQALVDTQVTEMNEESMLENAPPTAQQA
jgi:uncharacterized membrane protein